MKRLKYFVLLLAMVLLFPLAVFADEEETTESELVDTRAIIYFFRGEGCPHCADAEEWFESIESEYGEKFAIVDYETWYDTDNAELMQKVSDARGDNATGVPYIIIGDKSWIGFDKETYGPEILAQIDAVYATEVSERYDALSAVGVTAKLPNAKTEAKSTGSDVLALIIILVIVGGVCFGIYKARQSE